MIARCPSRCMCRRRHCGRSSAAQGYRVPANPSRVHRGLPSRHLTLVVELAGPLRIALGGSVAAHGVIGGLHTSPALLDASRPQEGLQYDLTVLGAQALLGVPASELRGLAVDLADLLGPQAHDLVDQLHATGDQRERFRVLDAALLRRLRVRSAVPLGVPAEVARRRGGWSSPATAGRASPRWLPGSTGVGGTSGSSSNSPPGSPQKQASRIARFEAARRLLLRPRHDLRWRSWRRAATTPTRRT